MVAGLLRRGAWTGVSAAVAIGAFFAPPRGRDRSLARFDPKDFIGPALP
jgi:hypothetical protein